MKSFLIVVLVVFLVGLGKSTDMAIGTTVGGQLMYAEDVKLTGIPLTTRTKNVFFTSDRNQIIRGISAIDLNNSTGQVIVTAGGVGSVFTNVRIKSQRGEALNYQVQIFV